MPSTSATLATGIVPVDASVAAKLEEVCPVDIFKNAGGQVEIVDSNVDDPVLAAEYHLVDDVMCHQP